jgi:hypothetical protein
MKLSYCVQVTSGILVICSMGACVTGRAGRSKSEERALADISELTTGMVCELGVLVEPYQLHWRMVRYEPKDGYRCFVSLDSSVPNGKKVSQVISIGSGVLYDSTTFRRLLASFDRDTLSKVDEIYEHMRRLLTSKGYVLGTPCYRGDITVWLSLRGLSGERLANDLAERNASASAGVTH